MIKTPLGTIAVSMDRTMLMSMWAKTLIEKPKMMEDPNKPMLFAGIGHPTLPIELHTVKYAEQYWHNIRQEVQTHYKENYDQHEINALAQNRNLVRSYGHPQGEIEYREKAATALSRWYDVDIQAADLMFTNGGCASLYNIYKVLDSQNPNGSRIILPMPCYPLHMSSQTSHLHHPIKVLNLPGYKITATAIQQTIEEAIELGKQDQKPPKALVLCDPYNPLGTTIDKQELPKIAAVLEQYPDILLVLDEPYAEMSFDGRHTSLFSYCNKIHDRVIVMRSATKSFSLAGERMSVTICKNVYLMSHLLEINILTSGHAALSQQAIYSDSLANLNDKHLNRIKHYYQPQLEYAYKRLKDMGADMPDSTYKPNSTFYILCNLKDLYYLKRSDKTNVCLMLDGPHTTAEEIAYTLLFSEAILITPLSYYGLEEHTPYFRITCAIGTPLLEDLFDRIEKKLVEARLRKHQLISDHIRSLLPMLEKVNKTFAENAKLAMHLVDMPPTNMSLAEYLNESIKNLSHYFTKGNKLLNEYNKSNIIAQINIYALESPSAVALYAVT